MDRLLTFPSKCVLRCFNESLCLISNVVIVPVIAAVNGHAFAAGFIISLACDYRIMQSNRGWCSMNEVSELFGLSQLFLQYTS